MEQEKNEATLQEATEMPDNNQEVANENEVSIEDKARAYGWKDIDTFSGDESKFISAEEYVKASEEALPMLRKSKEKLEKNYYDIKGELEQTRRDMEMLKKIQQDREEEAYNRGLAELKQKQRAAAEDDDFDAYDRYDQQMQEMQERKVKREQELKQPQQHGQDPNMVNAVKQWVEKNPWYNSNYQMNQAAQFYSNQVAQQNPYMPVEQQLEEVTKRIMQDYPEQFNGRSTPTKVAAPNNTIRKPTKSGLSYNDLPDQQKQIANKLVSQGHFKNMDEYLSFYNRVN